MLELRALTYHYPGQEQPALDNVTLALPPGERVVLLGRNGSGKSTLIQHCNGILRPKKGEVWLDGERVTYDRDSLQRLRQRVGLVLQNPDEQLFSASVRQDISFGPLNLGLTEAEARRRVSEAAELCQIGHLLERPVHALSGGEKVRAALAGVLAMEPDLLLVDETTSSLDPWVRGEIFDLFDMLVGRRKTVVLASHNLAVARHWPERVLLMEQGSVVVDADPVAVFEDEGMMARLGLKEGWRTW